MANVVRRAIGPNDAGIPEDEVVDIILPLYVPKGIVLRCRQTGDFFGIDGSKLEARPSGSPTKSER
jgi:hypothetical protein